MSQLDLILNGLDSKLNEISHFPTRLFHLHITLKENLSSLVIDGEKIGLTSITLPYPNDELYEQCLTVYKTTSKDKVINMARSICSAHEFCGVKVEAILKVEDVLKFTQDDKNHVCYMEIHIKDKEFNHKNDVKQYFSYSHKNQCYMNAVRLSVEDYQLHIENGKSIYEHYGIPIPKQTEACIFEEWVENIEEPWIDHHHQKFSPIHFKLKA